MKTGFRRFAFCREKRGISKLDAQIARNASYQIGQIGRTDIAPCAETNGERCGHDLTPRHCITAIAGSSP
jgi:hypothetical protein